jgi:hypothetical protein
LEKRPFLLGREFENFFKTEPELMRPIYLRLDRRGSGGSCRGAGLHGMEMNIVAELRPLLIGGKRQWKEEGKVEEKKELSLHTERMHIYKTVRFASEIRPEGVKAILKNGILESTLPKEGVVKEVKIRGQAVLA